MYRDVSCFTIHCILIASFLHLHCLSHQVWVWSIPIICQHGARLVSMWLRCLNVMTISWYFHCRLLWSWLWHLLCRWDKPHLQHNDWRKNLWWRHVITTTYESWNRSMPLTLVTNATSIVDCAVHFSIFQKNTWFLYLHYTIITVTGTGQDAWLCINDVWKPNCTSQHIIDDISSACP